MSEKRILRNKEKIVELLNANIDMEWQLLLKSFRRFSVEVKNVKT